MAGQFQDYKDEGQQAEELAPPALLLLLFLLLILMTSFDFIQFRFEELELLHVEGVEL